MDLIRSLWSLPLAALLCGPIAASAQDCTLGIYGDEAGESNVGIARSQQWGGLYTTDIYYVVHTQGFLMAVSWDTEVLGNFSVLGRQAYYQDYATFLETRPEGYRIGLGTCHWGTGQAITIMQETLFLLHDWRAPDEEHPDKSPVAEPALVAIPNVLQDPEHIMVSDCTGELRTCEQGTTLLLYYIVPAEGTSFGKIKAMFR